ncbi:DoxX family protein [Mycobacterium sp. GA-2829]|uniref:DoxX family protein n=1 Tax=Mycobacterium sp. GA-2829 TaxID=1772283 RepID=UPI00073FD040|nr:DoxX family protein [Mycobacterium sp. GA-2829]KUI38297.1 hypothetical protein AU194_27235 [Mycobacterium sp. GA-2829]
MRSQRTYQALGVYMALSAVVEALEPGFIARTRETVQLPPHVRRLVWPLKAAAAASLLAVRPCPGVARLGAGTLTGLFVLAVAAHIRVRDLSVAMLAAAVNAAVFAAVSVRGP